jgi:hypothetical protein
VAAPDGTGMDQWQQLLSLVTPRALPVCPVDLAEGEREVARVAAERQPGSVSSIAGDMVVTTARLLFVPLVVHGPAEARAWSCVEGSDDLVRVRKGTPPRLFRPPTIRVTDSAGDEIEIGVLSGRRTPNFSAANGEARDTFLDTLPPWLTR